MDPAALGTTIIGLDRIRREEDVADALAEPADGRRREGTLGAWWSLRRQLAAALRGAARRVEPTSSSAS